MKNMPGAMLPMAAISGGVFGDFIQKTGRPEAYLTIPVRSRNCFKWRLAGVTGAPGESKMPFAVPGVSTASPMQPMRQFIAPGG